MATTWRSTRITRIHCYNTKESGDEIYLIVNGLVIRPAGDPDYWLFENDGEFHTVNIPVVEGPPTSGARGHVTLMEQSAEHLQLGAVLLEYDDSRWVNFTYGEWASRGVETGGGPGLVDSSGATYSETAQEVEFHYECHYGVTFTTQERVI